MSPLARGRGSKPGQPDQSLQQADVAPRTGAWIETPSTPTSPPARPRRPSHGGVDRNLPERKELQKRLKSPLARGRGSKHVAETGGNVGSGRPSHEGVDRNTGGGGSNQSVQRRPSHGGVDRNGWVGCHRSLAIPSPLARGRGSKQPGDTGDRRRHDVVPRTGAWIETGVTWMRQSSRTSPLARGRGSKHNRGSAWRRGPVVAPGTGAWIETRCSAAAHACSRGRPSHGGVDRNLHNRLCQGKL